MKALWGGRFKEGLADSAKAFSYSLVDDHRLAPYDIAVNRAHVNALRKADFLTEDEAVSLRACLDDLATAYQTDRHRFQGDDEDIHSCIERLVTEALGPIGRKLHTGKSRNDQVITDVRLCVREASHQIQSQLTRLMTALVDSATTYGDIVFPGMTHFQTAQPVLLGHHLLAYVAKFQRDYQRIEGSFFQLNHCPLGSGALAGHNYPLDREGIADELGFFSGPTTNSMDAVSDRDFLLDFLHHSATIMLHLSRLCEELVLWSSPLVGFITIGDAFTTGSSIMPQKKNPDIAELIRGKYGRVQGHMVSLFTTMKALPLTYNRDLQEDKVLLFDTIDTVYSSVEVCAEMIPTIVCHADKMKQALQQGFICATELADYMVLKGIPFRDAHEKTGQLVLAATEQGVDLHQLSLETFQSVEPMIETDVYEALKIESAVAAKDVLGGTAANQFHHQLNQHKERLSCQPNTH